MLAARKLRDLKAKSENITLFLNLKKALLLVLYSSILSQFRLHTIEKL